MKLTYAVVFEQTPNNYCASVPDVPGCVSAGDSLDEMRAMIREAFALHIEDLLESGEPLPEPKMSIDDAIAYHNEPIPEDVLESYAEYGDNAPHALDEVRACGDRGPGSASGSGEMGVTGGEPLASRSCLVALRQSVRLTMMPTPEASIAVRVSAPHTRPMCHQTDDIRWDRAPTSAWVNERDRFNEPQRSSPRDTLLVTSGYIGKSARLPKV